MYKAGDIVKFNTPFSSPKGVWGRIASIAEIKDCVDTKQVGNIVYRIKDIEDKGYADSYILAENILQAYSPYPSKEEEEK